MYIIGQHHMEWASLVLLGPKRLREEAKFLASICKMRTAEHYNSVANRIENGGKVG